MKFVILVWWLVARARAVRADGVTDVYLDGVAYQTEVLYNLSPNSFPYYSLAVDYKYNNLYLLDDVNNTRIPVKLNLHTKDKSYLGGILPAFCVTMDQETHDLYIGTIQGFYKYTPSSGKLHGFGSAGFCITHVFFKKQIYYSLGLSPKLSTFINGHSHKLDNMQYGVDRLVIDNEDVMFFSNYTGLYSRQMDSDQTTKYYNKRYVNNLALDRNGKVYFASNDGIYEIIKSNASYRRVVSVKEAQAIAFDNNNNIIYCDKRKVYRLKPKAEINITNNCSSNTINIEQQLVTKLDIMDKKIDKLMTDHVEILTRMNRKNYETDPVQRKQFGKILMEQLSNQSSQVHERVHYSASSPDDSHQHQ